MARFDQNWNYRTPIQRAITSFNVFIEEHDDAGDSDSPDVAAFAQYGGEGRCLLDYIYAWLATGPGSLVCPTYEGYLLGVIGIIDDTIRRERKAAEADGISAKKAFNTPFLRIFHWTKRQRAEMDRGGIAERRTPWGHSHPALDRETYNFHRADITEDWLEQRLKIVVDKLKPPADTK